MDTYRVQRRDMEKKAKRLRRDGYVTGNLFGRDIEQSIPLQFEVKEAESLRKSGHTQMTLDLEGKKYNVLLKELHYDAAKHQIVEMDFQELVKGEVIHATAEVVLENKDAVTEGVLEQLLSEVAYKAKAEDVVEKIVIDCSSLRLGDTVTVADLAISNNKKVEVTTHAEQVVVEVIAAKNKVTDAEEEEDASQAAS
ncbi:large subunit ribosomal protein L25 [Pseudobutyrivibrio sp. ACV-2]|uniref:50S ribosomal protein L25 n=1 Tax=Pseudobutyrivibrio sp. ACV-2 TaxID=1520801 RepID=UPI000896677C|nr:50S ribosomal protein L25 [Pseudobutyrivibrio sp. ACV-2]SEA99991.1 large subunit ribosomal protein L25 [Pseudobutyrivibrio sp. ACV-2]